MLGFIFIGVGIFIIFDAAYLGVWELTFGIAYILFGLLCFLGG